jgi:hypothetical protein
MKADSTGSFFFKAAGALACLAWLGLVGMIGARAARAGSIIPVTTTIQAAINLAQNGDTISIPTGTYTESLAINKSLTLLGQADQSASIYAPPDQRVITVQPGYDLTIQDLTLVGGKATGAGGNEGGGVRVENATLTIDHCNLAGHAAAYGGAVFQGGSGQVIVKNQSNIYNNHATISGGGVYANGDLSLSDSWVDGNHADAYGGGATVWAGDLTMAGGTASFNMAGQNGGAFNVNNSISIDQVVFTSNVAGANGGAILQWNGNDGYTVVIQRATFDLNKAGLTGGAVSIYQGAATTISQTLFKDNEAESQNITDPKGGAVYFLDSAWGHTITITVSTFQSNAVKCSLCSWPSGGGLYALTMAPGKVSLDGDTFLENDGWLGGAVFADRALIDGATFQANSGGSGGGAYLSGASQITSSAFVQNSVVNSGGGLLATGSSPSLSVENTRFTGNSGGYDLGAALQVNAASVSMKNVVVADTQVVYGAAVLFDNANAGIELYHLTVNDTHLANGSRTNTSGIHVKHAKTLNIWNSMITNHGTGLLIDADNAVLLDHTLWFGNMNNIGGAGEYYDILPQYYDPKYAVDRYHLAPGSGAIDRGVNRMVLVDVDGEARDGAPELGADEFRAVVYLPMVRK